MRRIVTALLAAMGVFYIGVAVADLSVKDGAGTTRTIFNFVCQTTKLCNATVLIKSDGTEIGTSSNPVRTDPTGSTTQPVSASALPLPSGAATSAKQDAEAALVGPVTETVPASDTASSGLNGRLQRLQQTITALNGKIDTLNTNVTAIIPDCGATPCTNKIGVVNQGQSVPVTGTLQSSAVANGNGATLNTAGMSAAILTVNCATCSGGTQINFEGTQDGTNYTAISAVQIGTTTIASNTQTAGVTVWEMPAAGFASVRARISGYSAGTVTVTGAAVPVGYNPKVVNANQAGNWPVQLAPTATSGWSKWSTPKNNSNTALTTTVVAVKSSAAGVFGGYYISNPNAAVACLQVFDVATAGGVTLGTTRPDLVFCIPANSAANFELANGAAMANGIQLAAATTASGSSAPSTGLDVAVLYK